MLTRRVTNNETSYAYVAQTIRSLLPLFERTGVVTAAEVDIDTLASRLRDDVVTRDATIHVPELIAAWTRKR